MLLLGQKIQLCNILVVLAKSHLQARSAFTDYNCWMKLVSFTHIIYECEDEKSRLLLIRLQVFCRRLEPGTAGGVCGVVIPELLAGNEEARAAIIISHIQTRAHSHTLHRWREHMLLIWRRSSRFFRLDVQGGSGSPTSRSDQIRSEGQTFSPNQNRLLVQNMRLTFPFQCFRQRWFVRVCGQNISICSVLLMLLMRALKQFQVKRDVDGAENWCGFISGRTLKVWTCQTGGLSKEMGGSRIKGSLEGGCRGEGQIVAADWLWSQQEACRTRRVNTTSVFPLLDTFETKCRSTGQEVDFE